MDIEIKIKEMQAIRLLRSKLNNVDQLAKYKIMFNNNNNNNMFSKK